MKVIVAMIAAVKCFGMAHAPILRASQYWFENVRHQARLFITPMSE
jgi:hypothetical protein